MDKNTAASATTPIKPIPTVDSIASTALTCQPLNLTLEPGTSAPDLQNIKPWDLGTPVPFPSKPPYFYDVSTQEYWIFTNMGAFMVHKTPQTTINKDEARKLLSRFPTFTEWTEDLSKELKIPKSTTPQVVPDHVIVYNALHDSIIVKRVKDSTGLVTFWEDKVIKTEKLSTKTVFLQYIRPSFSTVDGNIKSHQCSSTLFHCGNQVLYCTGCTGYHLPAGTTATGIAYYPPRLMGQVGVPVGMSKQLIGRCLEPGGRVVNLANAYTVFQHCFNMVTFSHIPVGPEYMVANLLRDSLFIEPDESARARGASRVCWATYFNMKGQLLRNDDSNAANAAAARRLLGAGISAGFEIASFVLGL